MSTLLVEPTPTVEGDGPEAGLDALRDRLIARLRWQRSRALELYAWYEGEQDPPSQPVDPGFGYGQAFNRMRDMSRGAWARLVIDTLAERLEVQGVRTTLGESSDHAAWSLLQDSHIDADQRDIYAEAFITGRSYASVGGADDGSVRIAPESVLEVTHEHAPGDRRNVTAALKLFDVDQGRLWIAELYTRAFRAEWVASYSDQRRTPLADGARASWGEAFVTANELGVVPFVPFLNRPTTAAPGESELRELVPVMQRIQELELAKLVAAHTAVFRQKWATGLTVPKDPETGKPIEPYNAAVARLWVSEAPDTKFGSFEGTDIQQYLSAIDAEISELAAISRVPSYYLVQTELANPPSAESLIAAEAGLVAKLLDRMRGFGESWENVVRMAALASGDAELAADRSLEILWRTPERRNPAVVADAATKLQAVGVPWSELMSFVGYSPQAIDRMRVERASEALTAAAFGVIP